MAERPGYRQVIIALLLKVGRDPLNGLRDLPGRGCNVRGGSSGGNLGFNGGIELMQRAGNLGRLMQDVGTSEAS